MARTKYLIVVGGPTASGKTALSIRLARHFQTSILSADSRQFYREMSIGTAKPGADELSQAPHLFIDSLRVTDDYSVGDFEREALAALEEIYREKDVAILAGGSGLFIRALCEGLDAFPPVPAEVKEAVDRLYREHGLPALQAQLQELDPAYYEEVDRQNPQRLMRALAVCRASGRPYSEFRRSGIKPRFFQPIYVLLELDRKTLYERIDHRVDEMVRAGLIDEARALYPLRRHNALQTVGYQELFDHFEGKYTLEEAIELIKRNSRRYAKRQMTWFRKDAHWRAFAPGETEAVIDYLEGQMQ